jgi:hypothetical protein
LAQKDVETRRDDDMAILDGANLELVAGNSDNPPLRRNPARHRNWWSERTGLNGIYWFLLLALGVLSPVVAAAQSSSSKLNERQFAGEGLYLQNCAFCHSEHKLESQSSVHSNATNPKSTTPGTTIGPDIKTWLQHSPAPSDRAVRTVIQQGVPLKMPGYQYGLEPKEIDSIIAYLRTL